MWPINYLWTLWCPQGLGNIWVKFPLDVSSCSGDLRFLKVYSLKNLLPNHVTSYHTVVGELFAPRWWVIIPVKFCLDLFSCFSLFFEGFYVQNKEGSAVIARREHGGMRRLGSWMVVRFLCVEHNERLLVHSNCFPCLIHYNPQNFSSWSNKMFDVSNYVVITKSPMKSSKKQNHTCFPRGLLDVRQVTIIFPPGAVSETERSSVFPFPTWLPQHVTCDVLIIIKTFHMNSYTDAKNSISFG